jgi:hypothetical protein
MFSRRTSGRTRKSRQRMLALKVNSPRIMMFGCLKFCARFFKLGMATLAMVGVGFGLAHGWQKLFVENDEFLVREVSLKTMEGDDPEFLTHDRLVAQTGLDPAATIFSVDTDQLKEALLKLPEITNAKVSRRLPGDLKVEVTERKPVAWVACRSLGIKERDREFGLLVDEDYVPFPCASGKLWSYAETLPVVLVQSAERNEIVEGEPISHKGLRYALDLVKLSFEKLEGVERPAWVVVKDDIMLEMKTLGGVLATLSYYEQDEQLERLSKVTSHAREQGKSLAWANLIPRSVVPVRYH